MSVSRTTASQTTAAQTLATQTTASLGTVIRRAAAVALTAVGLALTALPTTGFAYDEASTSAVNVDRSNLILRGYDAVAYHTQNQAVKGSAEFTASHNGATYHFASAANRDAFLAAPATYEPAYGGFCAMGVALEKKLDGDPELFKVVDGRLYLNVNADVVKVWNKNIPGNIAKAETNWPEIKDKAPADIN